MQLGIKDEPQACLECGKLCKNRRSMGNHLNLSHKNIAGQMGYVLKHFLNNEIPSCVCGCGKQVLWHKLQYKFNEYITGHNNFVKLNGCFASGYKPTQEAVDKRNKSIRQTYSRNKKDLSAKIGKSVSEAFKDPKKNRALREGQKRGWADDAERKADLTRRNLEMLELGLIGPHAPFKTEWKLNPFTGAEEFMHSSWETAFLDACVSRGHRVTKVHGITIPYVHPDGSTHTYVPDFLAPDDRILYEIKGRHDEVDTAKWEAAQRWCDQNEFSFQVLFDTSDLPLAT